MLKQKLTELFRVDQNERQPHPAHGTETYQILRRRDAIRRKLLSEMLEYCGRLAPEDSYRAAMIFQHGKTIEEIRRAHELATAAALAGYRPARWLAAAALDRWLMYQGKPQKYGTNIVPDGTRQRVWDTDPATTDADRAECDVPPLAQMHRRAEEITRTEPVPPLDEAPWWLKQALRRWCKAKYASEAASSEAVDRP